MTIARRNFLSRTGQVMRCKTGSDRTDYLHHMPEMFIELEKKWMLAISKLKTLIQRKKIFYANIF